jgi:hypothetical protein
MFFLSTKHLTRKVVLKRKLWEWVVVKKKEDH